MKKPHICKVCKKIIIEDFDKWLKENKDTKYIECCYCSNIEKIR